MLASLTVREVLSGPALLLGAVWCSQPIQRPDTCAAACRHQRRRRLGAVCHHSSQLPASQHLECLCVLLAPLQIRHTETMEKRAAGATAGCRPPAAATDSCAAVPAAG